MIGIYKITSLNNRVYIGQSVNIEHRWRGHRGTANLYNNKLYNSFSKHGVENHIFEVIEECKVENLNERERYWQDFYDVLGPKGLNSKLTETSTKSGHITEWQKQQISKANRDRVRTKETKDKLSKFFKGRKLTEEHKAKIKLNGRKGPHSKKTIEKIKASKNKIDPITGLTNSKLAGIKITATNKGREVSEEMKLRISNTLKGRKVKPESIARRIETYRLRREQKLIDKNKENDN